MCVSWAELIAASGMAAVTYQSQFSHSETDRLIYFLKKNAEDYHIDMTHLCVFGASANTLAAQSLMQHDDYRIQCAVLNYGMLLTPDQKYYAEIDSAANMFGFYFSDLRQISNIPENIPMLVTRAGKDRFQLVNDTTDYFVAEAMRSNVPLTFINYPDGQHDFDVLDDTEISKLIIRQTVDFMKAHLLHK
jgi:acetyl esterase/lipase